MKYLLYPFIIGIDLIGLIVSLFCLAAWGKSMTWNDGIVITQFAENSWIMKNWYKNWGGTTIGHFILVAPLSGERIKNVLIHERVHVKQNEMHGLASCLLSLIAAPFSWPAGLVIWFLGPIVVYLCGMLVAVLYGGDAYRDNPQEKAAYDRVFVEVNSNDN